MRRFHPISIQNSLHKSRFRFHSSIGHSGSGLQCAAAQIVAGAFIPQQRTPAANPEKALCGAAIGNGTGACDGHHGLFAFCPAEPDRQNITVTKQPVGVDPFPKEGRMEIPMSQQNGGRSHKSAA